MRKYFFILLFIPVVGVFFLFQDHLSSNPDSLAMALGGNTAKPAGNFLASQIQQVTPAAEARENTEVAQNNTKTAVKKEPTYFVSPNGKDSNTGRSSNNAFKTIQKAVDSAQPGNIIHLEDGSYLQDFVSRRNGTKENPITIEGSAKAVVKGGGSSRVIEINHDYIVLEGFTVDGLYGSAKKKQGYRDKLIYVMGKEKKSGVTGMKIQHMTIKNAGGECVRLRYFATENEIAHNTITRCGVHDFAFKDGGKNGEGVYIGTAPEQLKDKKNPTSDTDKCTDNWIHHNNFDTQGNECVDIKEGSSANIVEHNSCTGQKDPESGGMDSRGNENVFRNNEIFGNTGCGVRVGGDSSKDGVGNVISENSIKDNKAGAIKLMRMPQAEICDNKLSNNSKGNFVGKEASKLNGEELCL